MAGMNPNGKYAPIADIPLQMRKWPSAKITKAPIWCSVDLRDGNQALINPMGIETKLAFFDLLVKLGFKEIEVGFPAASDTEYDFIRRLIEEDHIPDDVTIQVLCQAREKLVEKTMESLKGCKKAIFHIYNSTSPAQRKYTFNKSKEEIKQIAIDGVKCIKRCLTPSAPTGRCGNSSTPRGRRPPRCCCGTDTPDFPRCAEARCPSPAARRRY